MHVHVHGDMGGGQGISHLPFTVHVHVNHDDWHGFYAHEGAGQAWFMHNGLQLYKYLYGAALDLVPFDFWWTFM